ncbi:YchJ family protein [Noviherbaspirillum massiliense]|uniref:YchJ family protein n=1 Tax=Noviherbaspirillum massiliense TaxID=1465823 RepID=UPI000301B157|nr:YchJ family metal-binding protein [Noviherbaspirillum massiliense]
MKAKAHSAACPCGGSSYAACCGRYIEGGELPQTAEQLMRSRYTAYVLRKEDYLKATWHPSTRPVEDLAADDGTESTKWLGLEVRRHVPAGERATVEFVARFKIGGRAHRLHEISNFVREEGRWYYVDGSFPETEKQ